MKDDKILIVGAGISSKMQTAIEELKLIGVQLVSISNENAKIKAFLIEQQNGHSIDEIIDTIHHSIFNLGESARQTANKLNESIHILNDFKRIDEVQLYKQNSTLSPKEFGMQKMGIVGKKRR